MQKEYKSYELSGVQQIDGGIQVCEEGETPEFWTVYGRFYDEQGQVMLADALADFNTWKQGMAFMDFLTGKNIQIAMQKHLLDIAKQAIGECTDIMLYEAGLPVTYLEAHDIEQMWAVLTTALAQISRNV